MFQHAIVGLTEETQRCAADRKRVLAKALLYRSNINIQEGPGDLDSSGIQQSKALLADPALAACDTRHERAWLHVLLAK